LQISIHSLSIRILKGSYIQYHNITVLSKIFIYLVDLHISVSFHTLEANIYFANIASSATCSCLAQKVKVENPNSMTRRSKQCSARMHPTGHVQFVVVKAVVASAPVAAVQGATYTVLAYDAVVAPAMIRLNVGSVSMIRRHIAAN
jgi:hypothetical protein